MTSLAALMLSSVAFAGPSDARDASEVRLAFMQDRLGAYVISGPEQDAMPFTFRDEPLLRWSNPVSGKVDGGVFLWEQNGRPMVIDKVYLSRPHVAWGEAIQSLAPGPILMRSKRGQTLWSPAESGLRFLILSDVSSPSEKATARLVQMRRIARRFEMSGEWGEVPQSWEYRLMSEPIHRYAVPADGIVDGALFGFVQEGTNVEGLLVLEAVTTSGQLVWRYAVTRLSKYQIEARYRGRSVASLQRLEEFPPEQPFRHDFHWLSRWPFDDHD